MAKVMRVVKGRQLSMKNSNRPAISDDVMHRHEQKVFIFAHAYDDAADERPLRQIKRTTSFISQNSQSLRFAFVYPHACQIGQRDFKLYILNSLYGRAIDYLENRPQRVVTIDDRLQSVL